MSVHQDKQVEIINQIEEQIKNDSLQATAVMPVNDFDSDNRICLTTVHFPSVQYLDIIYKTIVEPLKHIFPSAYFYESSSLHLTIKNIRVISDPPTFTNQDVEKAKQVLTSVIPRHFMFSIYPYRLLLFKNNLALMSTTDEELDRIILHMNTELKKAGIPDDKQYINKRFFFSNMTIARFGDIPPEGFKDAVTKLSSNLNVPSYHIDSVSLISSNAVMKKLTVYDTLPLKGL